MTEEIEPISELDRLILFDLGRPPPDGVICPVCKRTGQVKARIQRRGLGARCEVRDVPCPICNGAGWVSPEVAKQYK